MLLAKTNRESVRCCLCDWRKGEIPLAEAEKLLIEHLRDVHDHSPRLICRTELKNGYSVRLWNKTKEYWPLLEFSGPAYSGWQKLREAF